MRVPPPRLTLLGGLGIAQMGRSRPTSAFWADPEAGWSLMEGEVGGRRSPVAAAIAALEIAEKRLANRRSIPSNHKVETIEAIHARASASHRLGQLDPRPRGRSRSPRRRGQPGSSEERVSRKAQRPSLQGSRRPSLPAAVHATRVRSWRIRQRSELISRRRLHGGNSTRRPEHQSLRVFFDLANRPGPGAQAQRNSRRRSKARAPRTH